MAGDRGQCAGIFGGRLDGRPQEPRYAAGVSPRTSLGATYQPGWRWSEHVGRGLGQARCHVEHVGLVVAGAATAAFADGRVIEMRAGDLFYIPPEPHDSWVLGNEPYVSLHFLGADHYAK
jgi:hypothetical protein